MHGRRKVKTSKEKLEEKNNADKIKAAKYSKLFSELVKLKSQNVYTEEALKLDEELLSYNPDCYTFWNYRREIIEYLETVLPNDKIKEFYTKELGWTKNTLVSCPKSYWLWLHRQWILLRSNVDWNQELELCMKMHIADSRNFLCWNHRRFVVEKFNCSAESELDSAMKLLKLNFSNYSAWHHRTVFFPKVAATKDKSTLWSMLENEIEWLNSAFFTEPEEQSSWIYHRWLLSFIKAHFPERYQEILLMQIQRCQEILELEERSKWPMLTLVILCLENNQSVETVLPNIDILKQIDPKRKNYYTFLFNKLQLKR